VAGSTIVDSIITPPQLLQPLVVIIWPQPLQQGVVEVYMAVPQPVWQQLPQLPTLLT
jgi:hypothetical protein